MRLDKYLKVSRLIKRRTVANEACDAGRVQINGRPAKASAQVEVGDVIEIAFGNRSVRRFSVLPKPSARKKRRRCSGTCEFFTFLLQLTQFADWGLNSLFKQLKLIHSISINITFV